MKKIIFQHIPKTGGTSVHDFLINQFPASKVCPERFNNIQSYTQSELNQYQYFSGHFDRAAVDYIDGEKEVFTFFREPKERILSLYYFWKSHKDSVLKKNKLRGPMIAKKLNLFQFLRHKQDGIPGNINNYTARVLVGKMHMSSSAGFLYPEDEIFDRSKEYIDSMTAFGLMECYDQSYHSVLKKLGFTPPETVPHSRNSKKNIDPNIEPVEREERTQEIEELLDSITIHDRQIYSYASYKYYLNNKSG